MLALTARTPGGLAFGARLLRIGWLRRNPLLLGQMARDPIPDDLVRSWTEPLLTSAGVRRDLRANARQRFDRPRLVSDTEALREFTGPMLVLWSSDNTVMPPEHGRRLADLVQHATRVDVPGALVLSPLDEPERVAGEVGAFLERTRA
jgi:pimeloyl-ACP methyl ester carboxylesterase